MVRDIFAIKIQRRTETPTYAKIYLEQKKNLSY